MLKQSERLFQWTNGMWSARLQIKIHNDNHKFRSFCGRHDLQGRNHAEYILTQHSFDSLTIHSRADPFDRLYGTESFP